MLNKQVTDKEFLASLNETSEALEMATANVNHYLEEKKMKTLKDTSGESPSLVVEVLNRNTYKHKECVLHLCN